MSTIIRGGRVLDVRAHRADAADVLITGDTITEIGAPGMPAPADATVLDARGTLLHPGLINSHTHAHGNLAKGLGDRWTLELLLTAGPWISGGRTLEDKHLSAKIGAVEMVLKGCTASYDLPLEFPAPTPEGLHAVGSAYAAVGLRAVVALYWLAETLESLQVRNARSKGWSWQEIADALGVSKQAVHKKHSGRT